MWKHLILIVLLSVIIIVAMPQAQQVIQLLVNAHDWVAQALMEVFSGANLGNALRGIIALLIIPFLCAFIPAVFYWLVRKSWFPYFFPIMWVIWLLQAGALLSIYKVSA